MSRTTATFPCPNAMSWAKTTTFLPTAPFRYAVEALTSWYVWRPERNVYLLIPVTASVAAGPEMKRTLFWSASGATARAAPEEHASGEDLVPLTDQVLRSGHGLGRVGAVVDERELDLAAVDLSGAAGCVVQPQPQTGEILRAVGCERARPRVDDADLDRRVRARCRVGDPRGRAGSCQSRDPCSERCEFVPPLHVPSVGRVSDLNLRPDSGVL